MLKLDYINSTPTRQDFKNEPNNTRAVRSPAPKSGFLGTLDVGPSPYRINKILGEKKEKERKKEKKEEEWNERVEEKGIKIFTFPVITKQALSETIKKCFCYILEDLVPYVCFMIL